MNPDELRRLACLLREDQLGSVERQEWALILQAWVMKLEQEQLKSMDEAIRRVAR